MNSSTWPSDQSTTSSSDPVRSSQRCRSLTATPAIVVEAVSSMELRSLARTGSRTGPTISCSISVVMSEFAIQGFVLGEVTVDPPFRFDQPPHRPPAAGGCMLPPGVSARARSSTISASVGCGNRAGRLRKSAGGGPSEWLLSLVGSELTDSEQ